ncbi:uncharacterized RING finger isoform X1 [Olea europaea subsp. europaea]|uniref:Uncharacterized RING finger isoform X1 n=1 Tax=Olea europaea subsp. europaea TaxID=158383 RepID=A0A8S0TWN6_OLEEU|nr:uncharacterized RING finger isoform X1 [Olea europaea subsp. europaea]
MGSSSSKQNAPDPSATNNSAISSSAVVRRSRRSCRSRVLQASCLRSHHSEINEPQASAYQSGESGKNVHTVSEIKSDSNEVPAECYHSDKVESAEEMNYVTSNVELDDWTETSFSHTVSRDGSSSQAFTSRLLNPTSRFLSRCSFYPGNLSFRQSRSSSLGSSRAYPASSTSFTISNDGDRSSLVGRMVNRNERSKGCDLLPACFSNRPPVLRHEDLPTSNSQFSPTTTNFSDNLRDNQRIRASQNALINRDDTQTECTLNLFSSENVSNIEGTGIRHADSRIAAREPIERNVRFSRTLSVGRLRDRVLRRSSVPDMDLYTFQQDRGVRHASQVTERRDSGHESGLTVSEENVFAASNSSSHALSSMSSSSYGSQNDEFEASRARETRYHDVLEHRSNFLERRRRIRSQVRALQRLGSRFENFSGHDRSCILSGQHRTGCCTCRITSREPNPNDDNNARASISRIVMLAEALFEVLDEIHQQSVVLSSRPSVSSIGSVPAPIEVVESLPLKLFNKSKKHLSEEDAQCYICLVEYEEGDTVRTLPCHHEFHRTCIDKWLKEIHRYLSQFIFQNKA